MGAPTQCHPPVIGQNSHGLSVGKSLRAGAHLDTARWKRAMDDWWSVMAMLAALVSGVGLVVYVLVSWVAAG